MTEVTRTFTVGATLQLIGCQFLVYARNHWMHAISAEERATWTEKKRRMRWRRYRRGDPVAASPIDHEWGSEEGLPRFVVVVVPHLPYAVGLRYISTLVKEVLEGGPEDEPTPVERMFRRRRFQFPPARIRTMVRRNRSVHVLSEAAWNTLISERIEHTEEERDGPVIVNPITRRTMKMAQGGARNG